MRAGRRVGLGLVHALMGHPILDLTIIRSPRGLAVRLGDDHVIMRCASCGCLVEVRTEDAPSGWNKEAEAHGGQ